MDALALARVQGVQTLDEAAAVLREHLSRPSACFAYEAEGDGAQWYECAVAVTRDECEVFAALAPVATRGGVVLDVECHPGE